MNPIRHRMLWFLLVFFVAGAAHAQLPDFTGLVADASPSVVSVMATRTADAQSRSRGTPMDDQDAEMQEFFRRFFGQPGMPGPQTPQDRTSLGTGFIISSDGYILTNHHVIDGADEIHVQLTDRRELSATLVGSDAETDVALLKVEESRLPAVKLGDSGTLKPGQWVVAIGSPFGFDHSVTAGIVSATGRSSQIAGQQYVPFIQTDVAINRGNSGGPLLDIDGKVVGINSQIFSNTGGFMGVSFAIPIETAMRSVDQLKKHGYVSRGLLGVNIQDVTRDVARSLGLPRSSGALVFRVEPGSAADKAGIKVQDVILAFDGQTVAGSAQLPPLVGATDPGSKVPVRIFRDGKEQTLVVTVGEAPRSTASVAGSEDAAAVGTNPLGFGVDDLSAAQREALGLGEDEGVVVTRVGGSVAQRLRAGDVILMVGKTKVGSVAQFNQVAKNAKAGEPVMLLVRRGDVTQFVTVTPPVGERK
ncbi:DegQ family serine endoprotease [Xanthomonadaceae bacterium JHOS43]|nr:DegQ family serine endoprotease [Xanthomonadaceae bacterium JHOS43]MCX7564376.1 DegQ family serine endoprotease [Xanthomonadaceae bacterium XH05]